MWKRRSAKNVSGEEEDGGKGQEGEKLLDVKGKRMRAADERISLGYVAAADGKDAKTVGAAMGEWAA